MAIPVNPSSSKATFHRSTPGVNHGCHSFNKLTKKQHKLYETALLNSGLKPILQMVFTDYITLNKASIPSENIALSRKFMQTLHRRGIHVAHKANVEFQSLIILFTAMDQIAGIRYLSTEGNDIMTDDTEDQAMLAAFTDHYLTKQGLPFPVFTLRDFLVIQREDEWQPLFVYDQDEITVAELNASAQWV